MSYEGLAPRERQVLDRLLAGMSEKEAAADLRISRHTVHAHVKRVYRKFGVVSRAELLAMEIRRLRHGDRSEPAARVWARADACVHPSIGGLAGAMVHTVA